MSHYQDSATVIVDDVEYEVEADLSEGTERRRVRAMSTTSSVEGFTLWGGTLRVPDEGAAWSIERSDRPQLRMPDGREAGFTVDNNSDLGTGLLRITGNGDPPF